MRFNLVVGRIENNELVFDRWYTSIADVYDMFGLLVDGLCVGYYIHLIVERNGSISLHKEFTKVGE